jgi:hypothetical protein
MQRYPKLLRAMYMSEAGWVSNDGISHKMPCKTISTEQCPIFEARQTLKSIVQDSGAFATGNIQTYAITSFYARSPATLDHLIYAFTSFADVTAAERTVSWPQTWILHHECHKLSGITTNVEKFQSVLFYKFLEFRMGRQPHSVAIGSFQDLAK